MRTLIQDLRYSVRTLLKRPGFTVIAILSLAFGILANTTIFSIVNELLLRPPAVQRPEQLLEIMNHRRQGDTSFLSYDPLSYPEYAHYRDHNQVFSELLAFDGDPASLSWSRNGQGEIIQGGYVSGNFFACLGVRAELGRTFLPEEDRTPGTHPVVVLSHAFWQQQLGADPKVIGSMVVLNGISLKVIGIAPDGFDGLMIGIAPDVWIPMMMAPQTRHEPTLLTRRDSHWLLGVGRLKPQLTSSQAVADLNVLASQLGQAFPRSNEYYEIASFATTLLPGPVRGYVSLFSGLFMAVAGLVLLIACANAASFLLAQATSRHREIAVRAALGASRLRLVRQMLTESVFLACLGGGLGLLLTIWVAPLLLFLKPPTLPLRFNISTDYRVLGFTFLISLLAGLLFGLSPAWRGTKLDLVSSLKDGTGSGSYRKSRLRSLLVIGQVAICAVLLVGGGLCLRSLLKAQAINPGFEARNRVAATLDLLSLGYTESQGKSFFKKLLERAQSIAGVQSASLTSYLPLGTTTSSTGFNIEGRQPPPGGEGFGANFMDVGPDYFRTMGSGLLRGREFTLQDTQGSLPVVIINGEMARRYWPDQDPIGQAITFGKGKTQLKCEIIGVVETGKYRTLGENPRPFIYQSFLQNYNSKATLVVKSSNDPGLVLAILRREIGALDPNLAPIELGTLEEHLAFALFPARLVSVVLGVFSVLALVLALVGLYGLIAYWVSQRTREIGIRMALGAQGRDVLKLVVGEGMILTSAGVAIGLGAGFLLTRFLADLLYGVSATDPLTYGVIALSLAGVTLLACYLPARRATRIDPLAALRCE